MNGSDLIWKFAVVVDLRTISIDSSNRIDRHINRMIDCNSFPIQIGFHTLTIYVPTTLPQFTNVTDWFAIDRRNSFNSYRKHILSVCTDLFLSSFLISHLGRFHRENVSQTSDASFFGIIICQRIQSLFDLLRFRVTNAIVNDLKDKNRFSRFFLFFFFLLFNYFNV